MQVSVSPLGAPQVVPPTVPPRPLPLITTSAAVGVAPAPDHVNCAVTVTAAVDP